MTDLTPERVSAIRYVDMDGNPLPVREWGALFENFDARVVNLHPIPGTTEAYLVTVLLGLYDPTFGLNPFGTAIRTGAGATEIAQYSTKVDAQEGHASFLEWLVDNDVSTYTDEVRRRLVPDSHPPQ
jgi:hypothetical protein